MTEITGHIFDVEGDNFLLKNILEAPILKYKEEIEVSSQNILSFFPLLVKSLFTQTSSTSNFLFQKRNF